MKVRATDASWKFNLKIKELHRIVTKGEILELSEDRVKFLMGNNPYGVKFVELLDEPTPAPVNEVKSTQENLVIEATPSKTVAPVETAHVTEEEPEVIVIKPKKKSTKKAKEATNG